MKTNDDSTLSTGNASALPIRLSWIALLLATALLLVSNGRHPVPIAPWVAIFLLYYFAQTQSKRIGLPLVWLVLFLTCSWQFRGMAPLPGIFYYILWAVYGLTMVLPFWIARIAAPRLRGLAATMVFPCAWIAMEWLVASFTPYGSWNSLAYSQHENLVLLQLISVTGLYGLSFLITWCTAIVYSMIPQLEESGRFRRATVFGAVLFAVLLGGGLRLAVFAPDSPTVRVASLTSPDLDLFEGVEGTTTAASFSELTEEDAVIIQSNADAMLDDLLRRAEQEATAGAKIIFWGETNNFALKQNEPAMIARGMEFARTNQVTLGMASAVFNPEKTRPLENKIILIDPRGEIAFEYWKAIPVPGPEAAIQAVDGGRIDVVASPYGRLGAAICFDMDFPNLLKQAGQQKADILLVPSNDWREIDPWHTHMARFRAVEQGFNLVRHTSNGLSLAADYQGRVLASMDHYTTTHRNLVALVPTQGTRTVYSRIGDLFAYMCIAGMLAVIVLAGRSTKFAE